MIRPSTSWFAAFLAACAPSLPPPGGTSVGNPGKNAYRLAPPNEIVVATATAVDVTSDLLGCDGIRGSLASGDTLDLVGGDAVELAGGTWCGVTVWLDTLEVTGTSAGGPASITLEPAVGWTLWTADPVVIDETDYVLEIGAPGWISSGQLPIEGDAVGTITPDSDLAPALLEALAEGSGWYLDDDGDGEIGDDERAAGSVASASWLPPAEYGAEAQDTGAGSIAVEGCGNCDATGSPASVTAALLALLVARRRGRAPRRAS